MLGFSDLPDFLIVKNGYILNKLKIESPWDPAVPLLDLYPEELRVGLE